MTLGLSRVRLLQGTLALQFSSGSRGFSTAGQLGTTTDDMLRWHSQRSRSRLYFVYTLFISIKMQAFVRFCRFSCGMASALFGQRFLGNTSIYAATARTAKGDSSKPIYLWYLLQVQAAVHTGTITVGDENNIKIQETVAALAASQLDVYGSGHVFAATRAPLQSL